MAAIKDQNIAPFSIESLRMKGTVSFIAFGDIGCVGSVQVVSHPYDQRIAQISDLHVESSMRGIGCASFLMRAIRLAVDEAKLFTDLQEIQGYAANKRSAHLMGAEFGNRPMRFAKRLKYQEVETYYPFPTQDIDEVAAWLSECRVKEYPSDSTGTDELKQHSAFIAVDLRP